MEREFDLLKIQFGALREEIMEKMKLSHQLGYYKLLALGAMLGMAVAKGVDPRYENSLFLAVLLLPVVFDAALYFNGQAIVRVGTYIRTNIEPQLKKYAGTSEDIMLWEEYINVGVPGRKYRIWWNLFEAVQPTITLALQIIILGYLLENKAIWSALFGGLFMIFETVILILAVMRK